MDFGCGAVDMAASDCVGGPTGRSNEGSVTTTLGFVISLVFLIRHHFFWTHSHRPSLCRICQILLWPHFLVSTGATLRPDLGVNTIYYNKRGWWFSFLIMVPLVPLLLLDWSSYDAWGWYDVGLKWLGFHWYYCSSSSGIQFLIWWCQFIRCTPVFQNSHPGVATHLEYPLSLFDCSFHRSISFWIVWWRCIVMKVPTLWKLVKFLASKLRTFVWYYHLKDSLPGENLLHL